MTHPRLAFLVLKRSVPVCAAAAIACALLFASCEEKIKPSVSSAGVGRDLPSQESWNATITFTDSARVSAILRAGHIAMYAETKRTLLDSGIVVDFFDKDQRHTSVLTARRGIVNDLTKDFEARDNVVVISDSGTTLKTEVLFWANATQKVSSPAFVAIDSPTEHIRGQGFESDQALRHYTVFKVTGQAASHE
jgi:LPS export ABC transporter protein LptC